MQHTTEQTEAPVCPMCGYPMKPVTGGWHCDHMEAIEAESPRCIHCGAIMYVEADYETWTCSDHCKSKAAWRAVVEVIQAAKQWEAYTQALQYAFILSVIGGSR